MGYGATPTSTSTNTTDPSSPSEQHPTPQQTSRPVGRFWALTPADSLRQALHSKVVIEYPTIHVCLPAHASRFPALEPSPALTYATSASASPEGHGTQAQSATPSAEGAAQVAASSAEESMLAIEVCKDGEGGSVQEP